MLGCGNPVVKSFPAESASQPTNIFAAESASQQKISRRNTPQEKCLKEEVGFKEPIWVAKR